jgi:ankyrin repeat protein
MVEDPNWTALHQATVDGNETGVLLSLKNGIEIEARDKNGFTALHYEAENGHIVVVPLLLQQSGVNISPRDSKRRTPLVKALVEEHHEIICLVLGHRDIRGCS